MDQSTPKIPRGPLLQEHSNFGFTWRFMNQQGLNQVKDFQKRNKQTMQYLLMDKERTALKNIAAHDTEMKQQLQDAGISLDSVSQHTPNELEKQDVSTSIFIQQMVEKLNRKSPRATIDAHSSSKLPKLSQTSFKTSRNSVTPMASAKLTVKQRLMSDLQEVLPSNSRTNVGRLKQRHRSVHPADGSYGLTYADYKALKCNDSNLSNYELTLSRIQRIQANAITTNQYDVKNYMNESSPLSTT